jgi:hypothetical protein
MHYELSDYKWIAIKPKPGLARYPGMPLAS